jgi:hypothetical protein
MRTKEESRLPNGGSERICPYPKSRWLRVSVGEQMAAAHRMDPADNAADPRLVELFTLAKELRADCEDPAH